MPGKLKTTISFTMETKMQTAGPTCVSRFIARDTARNAGVNTRWRHANLALRCGLHLCFHRIRNGGFQFNYNFFFAQNILPHYCSTNSFRKYGKNSVRIGLVHFRVYFPCFAGFFTNERRLSRRRVNRDHTHSPVIG